MTRAWANCPRFIRHSATTCTASPSRRRFCPKAGSGAPLPFETRTRTGQRPGTLRACHPLRVFQFVPAPMRRARARPVRNPRGRQPAPLHHPPCRCCPVAPPRCVEPAELRSLHWRAPERYGELLLHHRENLSCQRPRNLARDHPTRRELRHLQLSRDPHAPRAHLLGAVPVQSSWDPARDRLVDSFKQRSWLAGV